MKKKKERKNAIPDVKQVFNLTKERSFILEFLPSSCLKYYL